MIELRDPTELVGRSVYDQEHDRIGVIGQVWIDPDDGRPNWASVGMGLFGLSETFVPLEAAVLDEDGVTVPYAKEFVKEAPRIEPGDDWSVEDERDLYDYYGLAGSPRGATTDANWDALRSGLAIGTVDDAAVDGEATASGSGVPPAREHGRHRMLRADEPAAPGSGDGR